MEVLGVGGGHAIANSWIRTQKLPALFREAEPLASGGEPQTHERCRSSDGGGADPVFVWMMSSLVALPPPTCWKTRRTGMTEQIRPRPQHSWSGFVQPPGKGWKGGGGVGAEAVWSWGGVLWKGEESFGAPLQVFFRWEGGCELVILGWFFSEGGGVGGLTEERKHNVLLRFDRI